jgi:hypothetical protein
LVVVAATALSLCSVASAASPYALTPLGCIEDAPIDEEPPGSLRSHSAALSRFSRSELLSVALRIVSAVDSVATTRTPAGANQPRTGRDYAAIEEALRTTGRDIAVRPNAFVQCGPRADAPAARRSTARCARAEVALDRGGRVA